MMRYAIFSNSFCPVLNISSIGYAKDFEVTRFGPGVRSLYIIHYVVSGKGYFNGNPVGAGQGFLITPDMQECYYPDEKNPWEFLWIVSGDNKMAKIFEFFRADKITNIFNYNYVSIVKELSTFLVGNHERITNAFDLLEMFLLILKNHQNEAQPHYPKTNADLYLESAVNYIQSNIHTSVSVSDLTSFLGVSQPYLFKLFKSKIQMSPKEYILKQKLNRAQMLLNNEYLTVTQVANSAGFQDVTFFSKFFKLKTGLSPQRYRNLISKKTM